MFPSRKHLLFLSMMLVALATHAEEMQFLQAANYYANACIRQHGTPYSSADQGNSWQPIDLQEIAYSAEHQKSLAIMNSLMSKEKVTRQQLDEHIEQNVAAWAMTLENSRHLACQTGTGTVLRASSKESATRHTAPTPSAASTAFEWQRVGIEDDLKYHTDLSSDPPLGFGKIMKNGEATLLRVNAQCNDSSESYRVTLLDAQGNDVKTSTYKADEHQKIKSIKNAICSDAYGRNYQ